jgi:Peptidase M10 serralysin C terminal/RTX calcium-binding nonapeptide repeat (4 copies)
MALFRITSSTSVFKDVLDFQHPDAFNRDTAGADTLIVDPGAYLISVPGNGAVLAPTGAWTVNVNGSIVSLALNNFGISLEAGNTGVSTINIGVDGEVQGNSAGIFANSSANINNAGLISSPIRAIILGVGTHTITNSGTIIGGFASIDGFGTSSINTVHNSGQLVGHVSLGFGNDAVTNTGTISGYVALGSGTNRLTNSGTIVGNVYGGSGTDTVTNFVVVGDVMKSGFITDTIDLSWGNDTFSGGANTETVQDNDGADIVSLGGGNDTYIATGNIFSGYTGADGIDTVRGGAGIDTYDASAATNDCQINLRTASIGSVAANTATGSDISGTAGTAQDKIFGFENANGGDGNDSIFGSAADNTLNGGNGNDLMAGFGGNDTLDGGAGNDELTGGAGKDQLTGGPGADFFDFISLSDSGVTAGTRDLIADFEQGSDTIDLSAIDANMTAAGNDPFTFIGTNTPFTGTPGQLHAFWSAIGQIIEGDVNGDKKADFSIEIADPTHAITLTSTSFVL